MKRAHSRILSSCMILALLTLVTGCAPALSPTSSSAPILSTPAPMILPTTVPTAPVTQPATIPTTAPTKPTEPSVPPTTVPPTTVPPTEPTVPPTEASEPPATEPVRDDPKAPDFTVYDLEGNPVSLSDYFGKPIVLNFWASWCAPCKMEMPHFQQKYLDYGDQIQFLMVNLTDADDMEDVQQLLSSQGYTFPVLYDLTGSAGAAYGIQSIPATYFIDEDGYLIAYAIGALDAATLQKGIGMIL